MNYLPIIVQSCSRLKRCIVIINIAFFFILNICSSLAQNKPNIIVFISDDLNQQDLGCYGNNDVQTPNMDLLAAKGMRFTKAYAASPMCSPSRSSIFTGLYPFRNGSQMNHFTVRPGVSNLPEFLRSLGYRVVISGKTDVSPLDNFPFEVIGEEFGKYAPTENRVDRKRETIHLIQEHFSSRGQQPLCLIVAPWLPHVPWFPHKDFDPEKIKIPAYLADTKETRSALASYYQSISAADKMLGDVILAVDKAGQANNTVMMFTSDQGAQFPSAKWTVYDKGLKVPLIVRWPGHVREGTISEALVSLVDITPTLIDIGGGSVHKDLDGWSFKNVLIKNQKRHHPFVFAETSVEPHFWYNYTPARSVITADGWHYIKNYHPGERFITHIDKVERNEFYFDSWIEDAKSNATTRFLLDRYSYRPPEELYKIDLDIEEFKNLANDSDYKNILNEKRALLKRELARLGETEQDILDGTLPGFSDQSYTIKQNRSASDLSFNRKLWNPNVLYITAYLDGSNHGGVICDYFGNFRLYAYQGKMGLILKDSSVLESSTLLSMKGQLLCKISAGGEIEVRFDNKVIINKKVNLDITKIKSGYVTCGKIQGKEYAGRLQTYLGKIYDLRFIMNELSRSP